MNDTLDESAQPETVVLELLASSGAMLGESARHVLSIQDDDDSRIQWSASKAEVWENGGGVALTVNLSNPWPDETRVRIHFSGAAPRSGYAKLGTPYKLDTDYSVGEASPQGYMDLSIPAYALSRSILLSVADDSFNEASEKIVASIEAPSGFSGYGRIGQISKQEILILDNDPLVTVSPSKVSVTEGNTNVSFSINLSAVTNEDIRVPFSFGVTKRFLNRSLFYPHGTASLSDFTPSAAPSVLIRKGERSAGVSFSLVDDTLIENTETVVVELGTPTGEASLKDTSATFTILDNDTPPTVSFATGNASLGEAERSQVVTLKLSRAWTKDVYIPFGFGGTATNKIDYAVSGLDSQNRLKITAGSTSASFTLKTKDDNSYEGDETIEVSMNGQPSNDYLPADSKARRRVFTISENDAKPVPPPPPPKKTDPEVIVAAPVECYAGFLCLSLDGSQGLLDGTTSFLDANFSGVLDFLDLDGDGTQADGEPGEPWTQTALDGSFALAVAAEFDRDGNGLLTAAEGRWALAGGADSSTGLPLRVPLAAPLEYSVVTPLSTLVENLVRLHGFTTADAELRVLESLSLSGLSLSRLNLLRSIEAGDGNAAAAFAASVKLSNAVLQIADLYRGTPDAPPLEFLAEQTYAALAKRIAEPESTLELSLAAVMEDLITGVGSSTGLVLDANPIASQDIAAGAATTITAGNQAIDAVPPAGNLDYARFVVRVKKVMQGQAAPALYAVTSGTATISDTVAEFTGANLDAKIAAATTGSLVPPLLGVSHTTASEGNDGTKVMEFTVQMLGDHDGPVSVDYRTLDHVAEVADGDYAPASGTLTWAAGDVSSRTIQVTISSDTVFEPDESLSVLLENASGAVIRNEQGYGYILNDDTLAHTSRLSAPIGCHYNWMTRSSISWRTTKQCPSVTRRTR